MRSHQITPAGSTDSPTLSQNEPVITKLAGGSSRQTSKSHKNGLYQHTPPSESPTPKSYEPNTASHTHDTPTHNQQHPSSTVNYYQKLRIIITSNIPILLSTPALTIAYGESFAHQCFSRLVITPPQTTSCGGVSSCSPSFCCVPPLSYPSLLNHVAYNYKLMMPKRFARGSR